MPDWLKKVEAIGIYGRFDMEQGFQPGVNILHGKNGTGKTTLLHILANILNGDFNRFAFLNFASIKVLFDDDSYVGMKRYKGDSGNIIIVEQNGEEIQEISVNSIRKRERIHPSERVTRKGVAEEIKNLHSVMPTAYFPAFRTMIEAWASMKSEQRHIVGSYYVGTHGELFEEASGQRILETTFARELFGDFVPTINYPSPQQIGERLLSEIQQAMFTISQTDRKVISEAFVKTFGALTKITEEVKSLPEEILDEIKSLSDQLEQSSLVTEPAFFAGAYFQLRQMAPSIQLRGDAESVAVRILDLYRKALSEMVQVQDKSFAPIKRYLSSVNEFLSGNGKQMVITRNETATDRWPFVRVKFDDETTSSLRVLSSGERQIVTLVYAATHMSRERIVLIDEPELSLHVDWQRLLLKKMSEQLGKRQIIACTHSPVIGADFFDRMMELELKRTTKYTPKTEQADQGEEQE
jgi:predicted ATP-binding protein involved in virulence